MNIGNIQDLRRALGLRADGNPRVGDLFAAAMKKAAGVNTRLFDVGAVLRWYRANPNFKIADVYPRRKDKPGRWPNKRNQTA